MPAAIAAARRPFTNSAAPERLRAFLDSATFARPTLVLDIEKVAENYRALKAGLGKTHIHYAVKANPERAVLEALVAEGSRFDAASRQEIALCRAAGAQPQDISFGNTVKKPLDIAWAFAEGIDLFAADSAEELEKIAAHAPGTRVYIRFLVENSEADWPLSRKFGVPAEGVLELMDVAVVLGLRPVGISFHVGSQTRRAAMWRRVLEDVAKIWHAAVRKGHDLSLLNIGGGFPTYYGDPVEDPENYGRSVRGMVGELFGHVDYVMAEPGRGLVGNTGVIAAEVLLVARKRPSDIARWVTLDIGKFSGLAETMDEAIRYQIETTADGGEMGPCILAGPSCDSADVLYEKRPMQLPVALKAGDQVRILATGAYTTTYASIGFNGFPPLDVICI
ncbi:type III PLP-dependent enzyme [Algicella marina]|uniref:ornithine decarboxylase n=1 Tax=Algicella marina TaxID=2683284 RepID=A0A6P1T865_9RHOB|nr:type III PLP-dependent enzyme [Algicella marina]